MPFSIMSLGVLSMFLEAQNAPIVRIDETLAAAWLKQDVHPAARGDDLTFLRRIMLDMIGRVPTLEEVRAFERDFQPNRRARLVEKLLHSEEHADYWSRIWTPLYLGHEAAPAHREEFRRWLRNQFAHNVAQDKLAEKLLTASGLSSENAAVHFLAQHLGSPMPAGKETSEGRTDMVPATSRSAWVFLAAQLQCAQCHCHPFNPDWQQKHFWGVNVYFRQTELLHHQRGVIELRDNPELNRKGFVFFEKGNGAFLPTEARFLDGRKARAGEPGSRREHLAGFVTSHPLFVQAIVNRTWRHFLGRGLLQRDEDDFGSHNDVIHPELLEGLASDFVASGHDVRQLIRWITASRAYQIRCGAPTNDDEETILFQVRRPRPLTFDQLFDSILTATGEVDPALPQDRQLLRERIREEVFARQPETRPDDDTFRQPAIASFPRVLWMMNGPNINSAILKLRAPAEEKPEATLDRFFLSTLTRYPTSRERSQILASFRQQRVRPDDPFWQDLFWALLNTQEFLMVR